METFLKVKTKYKEDAGDEPVSPTGQYFNSKTMSVRVLSIMESEIPINDMCTMPLLRDLFLPINPRFSSIMVTDREGVKRWKRVDVNLNDHINIPSYPEGLSTEEYDEYFDKYITDIAMKPFPKDRPLWDCHILKFPTSKAAGHLIFKLHHALGDGFSLMGVLLSCMQRADNPSLALTFPSLQSSSEAKSKADAVGCLPKALSAIYNTTRDFGWSVLKSAVISDDTTPIRSGAEDVEFHPVQISTVEFSLDQIKHIKEEIGATINDVLTGIIFLGTRLYMQATGTGFCNSESTALVLLNTRNISGYKSVDEMVKTNSETKWGNQFAFLHVGLPPLTNDKSSNPLDFISEAQTIIQGKRNSLAVYLTGQSLEILRKCRGPEAAAQFIHSTLQKSTMTVSNMIGPVEKMAIADHPCKGVYFMVVGVPQSLTITVLSYMRTLRIAIGVEKGYIDVKKFNSCTKDAFQMIYKAAVKMPNDG
ncbi:O-acyltransferase WSD1 [Bienertia sinuspersici]